MKKTNQPKETMNTVEKLELKKNDLVNEIDILFYDIENIEEQASLFRAILKQHKILTLEAIKDFIKEEIKK
jgi:hypothetical protein|tara:strand:+ start:46 stop:258 length:213 start_codon:yes stop_codon:yes gene_type:complete